MNTKVNLQTILIVFMICVTVIVSTNSYANAQVGGKNNASKSQATEGEVISTGPVTEGPGFIMVSPFDFHPVTANQEWTYSTSSIMSTSTSGVSYVAGLTLPHDATITKVTLYFQDNSDLNLGLWLNRAAGSDNREELKYLVTAGKTTGFQTISGTVTSNNIVDNQSYSYWLAAYFPASAGTGLKLTNVRIDYAYIVYTPTIMK